MWLRDTGILEKVKYDTMNPPIPIPDAYVRINQPLILGQLGIIMIIVVVGLSIATIVFFIELCKRPRPNGPKFGERKSAHPTTIQVRPANEGREKQTGNEICIQEL